MPTVLITGASRGLGLEFTRQYAAEGWAVYATCRDPDRAAELARVPGDTAILPLDVADPASVAILAERLRGTPLDLLINNAGIAGPRGSELGDIDYPGWLDVLAVNTLGPMRVTEAFLDGLREGERKTVVTITSGMGSIADNTSGGSYIYRSSKAAVNMVMKSLAVDLAGEGFTVVVINPGWVRTDMGGRHASLEPRASIAAMRRVIDGLTPADTGKFLNHDGREYPW